MKYLKTLLLAFFCLTLGLQAHAQDIPREATIKQIETYLNNLKTAQARFVQTSHDGSQVTGSFYLDRPGKLRFDYDAPIEDYVVADGFFIYFYDSELGEATNAPIGQTMADFILREDISLEGDITVGHLKRGGGYLQATLYQTADPDGGTLMLAFSEAPFELKKWRIIDAQGLITEIELFYMEKGVKHPDGIFYYVDPKLGKERRLNE